MIEENRAERADQDVAVVEAEQAGLPDQAEQAEQAGSAEQAGPAERAEQAGRAERAEIVGRALRWRNRWWAGCALLYLAVVPVALLIGFRMGDASGDEVPLWGWVLLALVLLFPLLVTLLVVWLALRRGSRWTQPALALGVERPRRKRLLADVRAGRAVGEEDQEIAVNLAEGMVRQRWIAYLQPLTAGMLILSRAIDSGPRVLDVFVYSCSALTLTTMPFILRDARRARGWLSRHAA